MIFLKSNLFSKNFIFFGRIYSLWLFDFFKFIFFIIIWFLQISFISYYILTSGWIVSYFQRIIFLFSMDSFQNHPYIVHITYIPGVMRFAPQYLSSSQSLELKSIVTLSIKKIPLKTRWLKVSERDLLGLQTAMFLCI